MDDENARTVLFQRELDLGFQECLARAKNMHEEIKESFRGRLELLSQNEEELASVISPWINDLYQTMTGTMFRVLAIMQPDDFDPNGVNLYFLPGYHSCLTRRRIFYQDHPSGSGRAMFQNLGVGLIGNPLTSPGEIVEYHDCCHARWYHYATTPPLPQRDFLPASPYHWFAYQQPRSSVNPHDLIASLTFSTVRQDRGLEQSPEHIGLYLKSPGHSMDWGKQVAQVLNNMPYKGRPDWIFPDRDDRKSDKYDRVRETGLREVRCLLISLWMHSVFEAQKPLWWGTLMDELLKHKLTSVRNSLLLAESDVVANDWGDQSLGRPQFNTWTTVSMHPLVAPPPVPVLGPREAALRAYEASNTYLQTIGWATMLSSVPLGLPFLSVVRPWIRMIYGMLRSAEVNVLLQDRLPLQRAAQSARILSHDMHKFMQEPIMTLIKKVDQNTTDAIDYRRYILLSLKTQSTFAYAVCNAAPYPHKVKELRDEILESITSVGENFEACLYKVANEVQHFRAGKHGARVETADVPEADLIIPVDTYVTCHLFVGEIVRNHCRHGSEQEVASLSVSREPGGFEILLEANGYRQPGQTFGLLDNALETLMLGSAEFEREHNKSRWIIKINIPVQEESL